MHDDDRDEDLDEDDDDGEEDNEDDDGEEDDYPVFKSDADTYKELDVCPYCGTLLYLVDDEVTCGNCGAVF